MLKSSPFGGAGERSEPERVFVLQKKTASAPGRNGLFQEK